MKTLTISSKYQIVIPSAARYKLGVKSGDRLIIDSVSDNTIVLKKEPTYKELIGTLPTQKDDPVDRIRGLRDNWN